MSGDDVRKADTSKLHSEINQYINHNLTLSTAAITVFGVAIGWIASKIDWLIPVASGQSDRSQAFVHLTFATCMILLLILAVIYAGMLVTANTIVFLSEYLREKGLSEWENDIHNLAKGKIKFQTASQTSFRHLLFFLLFAGTVGLPFAVNRIATTSAQWVFVCAFLSTILVCGLPLLAIKFLGANRGKMKEAWNIALNPKQPPGKSTVADEPPLSS